MFIKQPLFEKNSIAVDLCLTNKIHQMLMNHILLLPLSEKHKEIWANC